MRIRVIHRPTIASVDGLELNRFEPGNIYEVGTALGCLMLSEGWAEPAPSDTALLRPVAESPAGPDRKADDAGESPAGELAARNRQRSARPSGVDAAADHARRK